MKWYKRITMPRWAVRAAAGLLAAYLRFCFRTSRWHVEGREELVATLADGPVIGVSWHERLILAPVAWPQEAGPGVALRDPSPAGDFSALTQKHLGLEPVSISPRMSNISAARRVLQVVRQGKSLAITADGPAGPAGRPKRAVIDWARATGRPVYLFAWSANHVIRLKTWDRLMLPVPFSKGCYCYRPWQAEIPHRPVRADYDRLRRHMKQELDALSAHADRMAGVAADPSET